MLPNKSKISPMRNKTHTIIHPNKLQVFIKFKPPIDNNNPLTYLNPTQLQIQTPLSNKIYQFNRIFHQRESSQDIFNHTTQSMVDQLIHHGGNGLIFVYGNTGTGKTHTMGLLGLLDQSSLGLIPETFKYIFQKYNHPLTIGFVEMYMDEVYDLLDYQSQKKKPIRQDQSKQPYIENQIRISVSKIEQAYHLINIGLQKRHIGQQALNKRSSRGHGIITIQLNHHNHKSKLCFVDLAGSQRVKQSQSIGHTLSEAVKINSSLSALQTLLMNISSQSVRMYRANKLTRLLQPYMESGKIKLIVTSAYDSTQSIQFAKRCKGIQFRQRQVSSTKQQRTTTPPKQSRNQQKTLYYCLSNIVGVLLKISDVTICQLQMIGQVVKTQIVHSEFTLEDILDIKQIQNQINSKINNLEIFQDKIVQDCDKHNLNKFNLPEILSLTKQPTQFVQKIHTIGFQICQSLNNLSQLSHYKNIYKKQLFTSDVKSSLLSTKNKAYQETIQDLAKALTANQNNYSNNKIVKQLKLMGIDVQNFKDKKNNPQKRKYANDKIQNTKNGNQLNDKSSKDCAQSQRKSITNSQNKTMRVGQKITNQRGQQNSPFNKIHNKSYIYIQQK